jgi:flavin reductase (NADH)
METSIRAMADRGGDPPEPSAARPARVAGDYRELMSRFPTGVCIVTSTDQAGQPHGLTCSSLSSVSIAPPILLVCLKPGSPTLTTLQWRQRFAVNLLHSRARMAAEIFSAPVPRRFDVVRWRQSPHCALPWLDADTLGVAECQLTAEVPAGDHVVVLGEILSVTLSGGEPLLYGMRHYAAWPPSLPALSTRPPRRCRPPPLPVPRAPRPPQ